MKAAHKLAVLLSLGALAPFASAKTLEQAYLESYQHVAGSPVPIAVVSPQVSAGDAGQTVELEFTVNAAGKPSAFSVVSHTDATLAAEVVDAVKQWEFAPAIRDGVAVATKVDLPVHIVNPEAATRYASN